MAIIAVFNRVKDAFEGIQAANIQELNAFSLQYSCIFKVESNIEQFLAVPVSSILTKCIHIRVKSQPFDFIVPMPNSHEHH